MHLWNYLHKQSASLDDSFANETEPEEADLHGHIALFKAEKLHNRANKCMHGNKKQSLYHRDDTEELPGVYISSVEPIYSM